MPPRRFLPDRLARGGARAYTHRFMTQDGKSRAGGFDVAYVARLARLQLGEAERAKLQGQLEGILGYVEELRQVDVSGVEPMTHAIPVRTVLRSDEVRPGLDHETAMTNAPESRLGQFLVPPIIE